MGGTDCHGAPVALGNPPRQPAAANRLHCAVLAGRVGEARRALLSGAGVDAANSIGHTALLVAALSGRDACVQVLLAFGADPNSRCGELCCTPVHAACFAGRGAVLRRLLAAGGDLRLCDLLGRRPTDWAMLQTRPARRLKILRLVEAARLASLLRDRDPLFNSSCISGVNATLSGAASAGGTRLRTLLRSVFNNRSLPEPIATGRMGSGGFSAAASRSGHEERCEAVLQSDDGPHYRLGAYTEMCPRRYLHTPVSLRRLLPPSQLSALIAESGQYDGSSDDHPCPGRHPPSCGGEAGGDAALSDLLIGECAALRRLRHPRLLLLMATVPTEQGSSVALLFERVPLGSLFHCLHQQHHISFTAKNLAVIALQVCEALRYMHASGWLHCAVTSHAVQLMSRHTAKLACLEYAVETAPDGMKSCSRHWRLLACRLCDGVYGWMAPELMRDGVPSVSCDVYSLCVLLWEMVHDQVPFAGLPAAAIRRLVLEQQRHLQVSADLCPPFVGELLAVGLCADATSRDLQLSEVQFMLTALIHSQYASVPLTAAAAAAGSPIAAPLATPSCSASSASGCSAVVERQLETSAGAAGGATGRRVQRRASVGYGGGGSVCQQQLRHGGAGSLSTRPYSMTEPKLGNGRRYKKFLTPPRQPYYSPASSARSSSLTRLMAELRGCHVDRVPVSGDRWHSNLAANNSSSGGGGGGACSPLPSSPTAAAAVSARGPVERRLSWLKRRAPLPPNTTSTGVAGDTGVLDTSFEHVSTSPARLGATHQSNLSGLSTPGIHHHHSASAAESYRQLHRRSTSCCCSSAPQQQQQQLQRRSVRAKQPCHSAVGYESAFATAEAVYSVASAVAVTSTGRQSNTTTDGAMCVSPPLTTTAATAPFTASGDRSQRHKHHSVIIGAERASSVATPVDTATANNNSNSNAPSVVNRATATSFSDKLAFFESVGEHRCRRRSEPGTVNSSSSSSSALAPMVTSTPHCGKINSPSRLTSCLAADAASHDHSAVTVSHCHVSPDFVTCAEFAENTVMTTPPPPPGWDAVEAVTDSKRDASPPTVTGSPTHCSLEQPPRPDATSNSNSSASSDQPTVSPEPHRLELRPVSSTASPPAPQAHGTGRDQLDTPTSAGRRSSRQHRLHFSPARVEAAVTMTSGVVSPVGSRTGHDQCVAPAAGTVSAENCETPGGRSHSSQHSGDDAAAAAGFAAGAAMSCNSPKAAVETIFSPHSLSPASLVSGALDCGAGTHHSDRHSLDSAADRYCVAASSVSTDTWAPAAKSPPPPSSTPTCDLFYNDDDDLWHVDMSPNLQLLESAGCCCSSSDTAGATYRPQCQSGQYYMSYGVDQCCCSLKDTSSHSQSEGAVGDDDGIVNAAAAAGGGSEDVEVVKQCDYDVLGVNSSGSSSSAAPAGSLWPGHECLDIVRHDTASDRSHLNNYEELLVSPNLIEPPSAEAAAVGASEVAALAEAATVVSNEGAKFATIEDSEQTTVIDGGSDGVTVASSIRDSKGSDGAGTSEGRAMRQFDLTCRPGQVCRVRTELDAQGTVTVTRTRRTCHGQLVSEQCHRVSEPAPVQTRIRVLRDLS